MRSRTTSLRATLVLTFLITSGLASSAGAVAVNAGGPAAGEFAADAFFSGGSTYRTTANVDLGAATDPAPEAVYQSLRYGEFAYTFSGLTSGTQFLVRLHFAEHFYSTAGARRFDVAINGADVLTDFDIFAAAGGARRAVVQEFVASANTAGRIVVQFSNGRAGYPQVCGIEVVPVATADFALSVPQVPIQIGRNATTTASVGVDFLGGFTSSNVALGVAGLPSGATGRFSPNPLRDEGTSTLTITTSGSVVAGTYPITISATAGGITHTEDATLQVTTGASFSLSVSPQTLTVAPGHSGAATVTLAASNGFTGFATLGVSGLPAGASASFGSNPAAVPGTSGLTLATAAATPTGSYPLTVTATSGGTTRTQGITLTVGQGASNFTCTELIGFSQTLMWEETSDFQQRVDDTRWQVRFRSGGDIDVWADPTSDGWHAPVSTRCQGAGQVTLCSPCAQNSSSPDRVVLTITSHGYDSDVAMWATRIRAAIATIRQEHRQLRQIVLQPVVGGPNHAICPTPANRQGVRASFNHPYIDQAIAIVVRDSPDLVAGISPEVQSCSNYSDDVGHLTTAGRAFVGQAVGQYYGARP